MIKYREGYKYQLAEDYACKIELLPWTALDIIGEFYSLSVDGTLTVKSGYAWDGPSGPTVDTKNFMRGSLVHDVLYQMMREGELTPDRREEADGVLRKLCLEDGMSSVRAWWVYKGVRLGGAEASKPRPREVINAP